MVQKHTVEFNQVAMANSEGSEVMLNRVMTKDNIGVAVLLEVEDKLFANGKDLEWQETVPFRFLFTIVFQQMAVNNKLLILSWDHYKYDFYCNEEKTVSNLS